MAWIRHPVRERHLGHFLTKETGPFRWDLNGTSTAVRGAERRICSPSDPRPPGPPIPGVCRALPLLAYSRLMPRAGFEPATRGLEDRWSSPEDAHPGGCSSVARLMAAHPLVTADNSHPLSTATAIRPPPRATCDLLATSNGHEGPKVPANARSLHLADQTVDPACHAALSPIPPRQRCALRRQKSQVRILPGAFRETRSPSGFPGSRGRPAGRLAGPEWALTRGLVPIGAHLPVQRGVRSPGRRGASRARRSRERGRDRCARGLPRITFDLGTRSVLCPFIALA